MKRIQLFELEDFNWFPDLIRSPMTRLLKVLNSWMGLDEAIAKLVERIIVETGISTIVDLGSGSGGVMPIVHQRLSESNNDRNVNLMLTDLHPSQTALAEFKQNKDGITYHATPVDATKATSVPSGIKTMVNSFHHMPPSVATKILRAAQESGEPLLIFEMQENKIPTLIWALFLPLGLIITFIMALVLTPFSKPLTFSQLVFTYLIPVIPLCFAWDGQASYARLYSISDIDELLEGLASSSYTWKKGIGTKKNGRSIGTYLLGMPD